MTGGLIVFIPLFISAISGRLWCGWLCPAGGLQEIYFPINDKNINIISLKWFKYLMFLTIILLPIISSIYSAGRIEHY